MIGKLIGAIAGKRIASQIGGISGPGGALLGVGAATLLRRMGPLGLVTAAVGGYALKRLYEKREAGPSRRPSGPPR